MVECRHDSFRRYCSKERAGANPAIPTFSLSVLKKERYAMKEYTVIYQKYNDPQVIYIKIDKGESLSEVFERESLEYFSSVIVVSPGRLRLLVFYILF